MPAPAATRSEGAPAVPGRADGRVLSGLMSTSRGHRETVPDDRQQHTVLDAASRGVTRASGSAPAPGGGVQPDDGWFAVDEDAGRGARRGVGWADGAPGCSRHRGALAAAQRVGRAGPRDREVARSHDHEAGFPLARAPDDAEGAPAVRALGAVAARDARGAHRHGQAARIVHRLAVADAFRSVRTVRDEHQPVLHRRAARRPGVLARRELSPGETRGRDRASALALGKSTVGSFLRDAIPERLARTLCEVAGVDPGATGASLSRDARKALASALCAFRLPVTGDRGWNYAEVTAGGVPLAEIRLETMESRLVPGLHFCGEICDVDGRIGGVNVQWAGASGSGPGRRRWRDRRPAPPAPRDRPAKQHRGHAPANRSPTPARPTAEAVLLQRSAPRACSGCSGPSRPRMGGSSAREDRLRQPSGPEHRS